MQSSKPNDLSKFVRKRNYTDTQLKLQIQNRVNRLRITPKFEITKKLKYAITFQFQILSRNILPINMQETVQNKGKVNI